MRVVAKFVSDFTANWEKDIRARGLAQVAGLERAARGLEKDLEHATEAAGLGRLSKAWASMVFPERKGVGSLSAAAIVFVKGSKHTQDAVDAFSHGATIRSKDGFWLLIPTENAPKVGQRNGRGKARDNLLAAAEARWGRLRFVYRRGKPSLLVADNVRAHTGKRTGFVRASAGAIAKGNVATIVVFILVPVARLRKRFSIPPLEQKWFRQVPALINQEYQRLIGSSRG